LGNDLEKAMGKRLRGLREAAGLTQVEGALRLGIAQQLLSEYERGVKRAPLARVAAMAEKFRVSPSWLAFGDKKDSL
jgi:transcriptional regulator with XRE-family HTH domain